MEVPCRVMEIIIVHRPGELEHYRGWHRVTKAFQKAKETEDTIL